MDDKEKERAFVIHEIDSITVARQNPERERDHYLNNLQKDGERVNNGRGQWRWSVRPWKDREGWIEGK